MSENHGHTRVVILVLMLSAAIFNLHAAAFATQAGAIPAEYRPIAPWTGRLVLPSPSERGDGGVPMVVENSPDRGLLGRRVILRWDSSETGAEWFDRVTTAVNFDSAELEKANEKKVPVPTRLDGRDGVNPIESLAGARQADEVRVMLVNPRREGESVYLTRVPVLIGGSHFGLVRFVGPAEGDRREVVHYNPETMNFDGRRETVTITPGEPAGAGSDMVTSTVGIEENPLNEMGYYVYGLMGPGGFTVRSLEPRQLFLISPDVVVTGKNECRDFIGHGLQEGFEPGLVRRVLMEPRTDRFEESSGDPDRYSERNWPIGSWGVVIHLYGARRREAAGFKLGLPVTTGHFSFGVARVVACPITGERRFDIEYKQVFAHTTSGIMAGASKWHEFMGSLTRGKMYGLPVTDTIVAIPEMEPYDFGPWGVFPLEGFERKLEEMMAVYRVGAGTGISYVRGDISCVQDSSCALYASLRLFEDAVAGTGVVKEWLKTNPDDEAVKRFLRLKLLVRHVGHAITSLGIARRSWKEYIEDPLGNRKKGILGQILGAATSAKTVFPRHCHDTLLKMAANLGYGMWTVTSAMVGGKIPGVVPAKATSTTCR